MKTGNVLQPLAFIRFQPKRSICIFAEIEPLYARGLSITDIAEQTGHGRTAIWECLRERSLELRPQAPVTFTRWRQGRGKTRARPPYGFCYFQGEVIRSPTEYPTLLLIEKLRASGTSVSAIVDRLAAKRIKSRTGKPWSYNVIKAILKRIDDGTIDRLLKLNPKPEGGKK